MTEAIDTNPASAAEEEKLIQELETLIKRKGLSVELQKVAGKPAPKSGCHGCTLCSCVMCY